MMVNKGRLALEAEVDKMISELKLLPKEQLLSLQNVNDHGPVEISNGRNTYKAYIKHGDDNFGQLKLNIGKKKCEIYTYHDKFKNDHFFVLQGICKTRFGIFAEVIARGFKINSDGNICDLTEEELWDYH